MTLEGSEIIIPQPLPSGKEIITQKKISSSSNSVLSKKSSGSVRQFDSPETIEGKLPHGSGVK